MDPDTDHESPRRCYHHGSLSGWAPRYSRYPTPIPNILHLPSRLRALWRYFSHSLQASLLTAAGLLGLVVGFVAVIFIRLVGYVQQLAIGFPDHAAEALGSLPSWQIVLVPTVGGLLVGWMVARFAPEAKGHGVPEVMKAVAVSGGRIRPQVALIKTLASAISIGTGASVGREGPIVQIGAALGSAAGRLLKHSVRRTRLLVGCGAAAGIAATFNAPIAGAFFALEIILGHFAISAFAPIVMASVLSTVVSRAMLGDSPAFQVPHYTLQSAWEIPLYVILGLVAGVVAVAFTASLGFVEDRVDRIRRVPAPLITGFGGLILGLLFLGLPEMYGAGNEIIEAALSPESIPFIFFLLFLVAKLFATDAALGTGSSGGVFAPSLYLGAMAGGALGHVFNILLPGIAAPHQAYALVGMGAVVAGATHAPVTAIIILFELTGDYEIVMPLMIASTIATVVARGLWKDSVYSTKLTRQGLNLEDGHEATVMSSFKVGDLMRSDVIRLSRSAPLAEVAERLTTEARQFACVVGTSGRLHGVVTLTDLAQHLGGNELDGLVIAEDLARPAAVTASPDEGLDLALGRMSRSWMDEIPVVDDGILVGTVSRKDVLTLYDAEILRAEAKAMKLVRDPGDRRERDFVHLAERFVVRSVLVPDHLVGHSLKELDTRSRYGVTVLAIKGPADQADRDANLHEIPTPEALFRPGDYMVVVGEPANLDAFLSHPKPSS